MNLDVEKGLWTISVCESRSRPLPRPLPAGPAWGPLSKTLSQALIYALAGAPLTDKSASAAPAPSPRLLAQTPTRLRNVILIR